MTVVTDPYTILANALEVVIETEFSDLPFLTIRHDRLHASLGADGRNYVGIYPDVEETRGIELVGQVTIQFFDPYKADIDPQQIVDPRVIANKAERLRRALAKARITGAAGVWYFDVTMTRYTNDATGNKSRFEMTVQSRGNNSALVETTG
jgi:hypothetical protein